MSHGMQTNKLTKHYWVWPIAWYLFLGGLGGGIMFIAGVLEIIYHLGYIFAFAVFAAVVFLGVGSFLLVFELGQPLVFLRTFLSGTAIIKYGAVMLVFAMGFGLIWFLFYLPPSWNLFWFSWTWLREVCTIGMVVFGLGIMVYTGVLLSTMKSKPFWNTPALPVLFTVSALSTGSAFLAMTAGLWPAFDYVAGNPYVVEFIEQNSMMIAMPIIQQVLMAQIEGLVGILHLCDKILIIAEIVFLLIFVLGTRASGTTTAKEVALDWIKGSKAVLFWGGLLFLGLLVPLFLYSVPGMVSGIIAPGLILASGLLLRFLVVYSDRRRPIAGEERYYERLPKGDEDFMKEAEPPY